MEDNFLKLMEADWPPAYKDGHVQNAQKMPGRIGQHTVELRRSGIDVIGAVPWGSHFCEFYANAQDLVETLVPYFRAGLDANEFCMWVTSTLLHVDQAKAALRQVVPDLDQCFAKGQIEILDYANWYLPKGHFDADSVLQGWSDKLAGAQRQGFEDLRLTGNTFWLEQAIWDDFTRYEEKINQVFAGQKMIALCTYSLEKCGVREVLDVATNHKFALIKRPGRWEIIESAGHRKMEQALRESEEHLRLAMWAADLGVFEWDALNDRTVWENSRMYEIFGRTTQDGPLSKAELIEKVIHPDDSASFEAALSEGMQSGRLFHSICRIVRKDGALRWVEFSGRFKRDSDGCPLQLSCVLEDITARKQAEKELLENASKLQQSNQDLENFAYIASHDLQEPLRKIEAFGQQLHSRIEKSLDPEGIDYLERMMLASKRMRRMIDDLLELSRVATNAKPFEPVRLNEIARVAMDDLEVRIQQTQAQIEIGDLPEIDADPLQMHQLLLNLIGNALKFHREGVAPMVKIYTSDQRTAISDQEFQVADRRSPVAIPIEDNGIGFEPQYCEKIFQPFERLNARSDYEGTGIGLALCKRIVERHGGTISARSQVGEGSTFIISLPVK